MTTDMFCTLTERLKEYLIRNNIPYQKKTLVLKNGRRIHGISFGGGQLGLPFSGGKSQERGGFEPPDPYGPSVFKADALIHSATSPQVIATHTNTRQCISRSQVITH